MVSENAEKVLRMAKEQTQLKAASMEELRRNLEAFYARFRSEQMCTMEPVRIGHIPAFWIFTAQAPMDRVVLFFHGGGFTVGSTKDHLELCERIAYTSRCRVLSVDYRLAPEHIFPAALDDCVKSYLWLINGGISPRLIVPVGLSAGGNLVLTMLFRLRENSLPLPKAAVLLSPAVDLALSRPSVESNTLSDWLGKDNLEMARRAYLRGHDPKDPMVSPIYGSLTGLSPLLIQVGTHEILFDDVKEFAKNAKEAGLDVTFEAWENMFHCWQAFSALLVEGRQAIDSIGVYMRKAFETR
ncbi:MAG TPA: alpha/beta hydrolase [Syntrophorhabdaceae bacterium]|nr:alpha/beta hydrolase [Syntrophorhabdaceae bacterium]